MSVGFNWFKSYKVIEDEIDYGLGKDIQYSIEYIDSDFTTHGYGNRTKLQNIFKRYLNIEIPTIRDYGLSYKPTLDLIEPSIMSEYCNNLLSNNDYNLEDMEDRIEWIKYLSDKGYYVSYDVS